jgi:hypothetical protein
LIFQIVSESGLTNRVASFDKKGALLVGDAPFLC